MELTCGSWGGTLEQLKPEPLLAPSVDYGRYR